MKGKLLESFRIEKMLKSAEPKKIFVFFRHKPARWIPLEDIHRDRDNCLADCRYGVCALVTHQPGEHLGAVGRVLDQDEFAGICLDKN